MIDGLEFVELPEADWCCGLAGTQLITHYETSIKVLKRKTDNLVTTRAEYVASGCPACQMQLNVGVRRAGLDVQVTHPIVLLDMAYTVSLRASVPQRAKQSPNKRRLLRRPPFGRNSGSQ